MSSNTRQLLDSLAARAKTYLAAIAELDQISEVKLRGEEDEDIQERAFDAEVDLIAVLAEYDSFVDDEEKL